MEGSRTTNDQCKQGDNGAHFYINQFIKVKGLEANGDLLFLH